MRQNRLLGQILMLTCMSLCSMQICQAQRIDRDKVSADRTLYDLLSTDHVVTTGYPSPVIEKQKLEKTNERDIYLVKGDCYKIPSLCSDFYVSKSDQQYRVIFDRKFPMESFVNLMMNKTSIDKSLEIVQHMYGENRRIESISISAIHDLLSGTMKPYFSVTSIVNGKMKAILVFHHQKIDFIHMFVLETTVEQLFSSNAKLTADLYGNIPQSNLNNLFRKYKR